MRILGVSCDYHDSAAALVVSGEIVAAAEEERFSRLKHDSSLPEQSMRTCLEIGEVRPDDLDVVVFHEKPLVVLGRVLAARQRKGPSAIGSFVREMPVLLRRNLFVGYRIEKALRSIGAEKAPNIAYSEHHLSHAAAAFYPSPFETAAILTVDGVGEWATSTIGHGLHHRVDLLEEQRFPDSLGLLYSLITMWCGFEANEGEYKLMGLAPYGEPTYLEALGELLEVTEDGALHLDARRVGWWNTPPKRLKKVADLLGGPPRELGAEPTRREMDLASSVQRLTESAVLAMARHAQKVTGESKLCMAGGVALNCVANGRLVREGPFDDVWVQPAAGDSGSALGAALWYWHGESGHPRRAGSSENTADRSDTDRMNGALLGPSYSADSLAQWLDGEGVAYRRIEDPDRLSKEIARELLGGAVVGLFRGRMEFGPRALGNRSIIADPRSETVQKDLNLRVKGRESFRPFAPAVLEEHASDWFEMSSPSPYMLFTHLVAQKRRLAVEQEPADANARVQLPRSEIPACTHIDYSARVQTVDSGRNPAFHRLIAAFLDLTGCPVVLNTSFNLAGEPIVNTPREALACATKGGLDFLVMEECVIEIDGCRPPQDQP